MKMFPVMMLLESRIDRSITIAENRINTMKDKPKPYPNPYERRPPKGFDLKKFKSNTKNRGNDVEKQSNN